MYYVIKYVTSNFDEYVDAQTKILNQLSTLESSSFENGGTIPKQFGYKNGNVSPALIVSQVPESAKSLALIMDDPDAMGAVGKVWVHWVLWNIPTDVKKIDDLTLLN